MLTQERLKELLDYDPETGAFTWKVQRGSRAQIGAEAGCRVRAGRTAYRQIRIDGILHYGHRLAYLFMAGQLPGVEVGHDDQDGLNNRWTNLVLMSRAENTKNQRRSNKNTSGVTGVGWEKRHQKWMSQIKIRGRTIHLGLFTGKSAAIDARKAAEKRHGFHRLHGSG